MSKKYSYNEVKQTIENAGFILVSKEYIDVFASLEVACENGHIFTTTYKDFRVQKHKCPKCANKQSGLKRRLKYDDVKTYIKSFNYTLLSNTYVLAKEKLLVMCPFGHKYEVSFDKFRIGKRCPICYRINYRGENHPRWKGTSSENTLFRSSDEYKKWRIKVFERDSYTCQCCGDKSTELNAHHINNFHDNVNLRLDVNNGITLCEKCHSQKFKNSFHSIYGQFSNNIEQLNEYIAYRKQIDIADKM